MDVDTLFEKPKNPSEYSAVKISIASPEKVKDWSKGEDTGEGLRMYMR